MARIVTDRGRQREGMNWFYEFEMDCGCAIRIDERALLARPPGRNQMTEYLDRVRRIAETHDCDIFVHHAPERYRREVAARQRYLEPPIQYMGVPVIPDPMRGTNDWLIDWPREVINSFAVPAPRPERSRGQPGTPTAQEAPERVLRAAMFDHQNPMGFQPGPKIPEKKEDPPRPDRFDLIELD